MNEKTPFIHLLSSPNGGYFFDVNRNEIVAISHEAYRFLQAVEEGKIDFVSDEKPQEVKTLEQQGYLSSNKVKELKHPHTDHLDNILSRSLRKVALQLTQECNFRCKYCSYSQSSDTQRHHANRVMPEDIARKGILFLRDHSVDCDEVCVGFYGGEPLLEFDLVKKITLFSEEVLMGKEIIFTLTTNASLLNDEIVDFFVEHDFNLVISLDGIKEIHDKNRIFAESKTGTYDIVVRNLERVHNRHPEFFHKILINMVIDPANSFEKTSSIWSSNPMFKDANFQSTLIDDTGSDEKNTFSEEYIQEYTYQAFLGFLAVQKLFPMAEVVSFVQQRVRGLFDDIDKFMPQMSLQPVASPSGPCIPGEMRTLITVEGNLIACERVNEISQPMIIGSIWSGYDIEKVDKLLNIGQLTPDACKNCWAFLHCGVCCKQADENGQLSPSFKLEKCLERKSVAVDFFRMKIMLDEINQYYANV